MNGAPRFLYFPDLIVNLEEIAAVWKADAAIPGPPPNVDPGCTFLLRSGEFAPTAASWETVVARLGPVIDPMGVLGPAGKESTP